METQPTSFPRIRSFLIGLTVPFNALGLIASHPTLLFWSILPAGITLGLYLYVFSALQTAFRSGILEALSRSGLSPESWLAWVLLLLGKLAVLIFGALTFSFMAGIIASPFNDFLAERTERRMIPPISPPAQVIPLVSRAQLRIIAIDIMKTLAASGASLIAILLSWVPIVNILAAVMAFLLVSFQFISYPQTRRGLGVKDGLKFIWKHKFACTGFGLVLSTFFSIPFVASFFLPLAVVGGTLLVGRAQLHLTAPKILRLR